MSDRLAHEAERAFEFTICRTRTTTYVDPLTICYLGCWGIGYEEGTDVFGPSRDHRVRHVVRRHQP
jgi:hypothetical protein